MLFLGQRDEEFEFVDHASLSTMPGTLPQRQAPVSFKAIAWFCRESALSQASRRLGLANV
jgi:hypothetical protein